MLNRASAEMRILELHCCALKGIASRMTSVKGRMTGRDGVRMGNMSETTAGKSAKRAAAPH